jgi:hypothetical protein
MESKHVYGQIEAAAPKYELTLPRAGLVTFLSYIGNLHGRRIIEPPPGRLAAIGFTVKFNVCLAAAFLG